MSTVLVDLAQQLGHKLLARHWMVATAESCTGGGVAYALTEVAGSSAWVDRGFVTYTNEAKQAMLGVQSDTLESYGAVSESVVNEMTAGALSHSNASIAVALSGIAGPGGGTSSKPVGTVWIGWRTKDGRQRAQCFLFHGDRAHVRHQAIVEALTGLIALCE